MNKIIFQIMGAILLAFGAIFAFGSFATVARYPPHSVKDVVPLAIAVVVFVLVGIGLYRVRKWAALAFSILTICAAGWSLWDAIHSVPWSWNGIGYWLALVLIVPTILTVKYWHTFEHVPKQVSDG